jgi:hypothetical protein
MKGVIRNKFEGNIKMNLNEREYDLQYTFLSNIELQ